MKKVLMVYADELTDDEKINATREAILEEVDTFINIASVDFTDNQSYCFENFRNENGYIWDFDGETYFTNSNNEGIFQEDRTGGWHQLVGLSQFSLPSILEDAKAKLERYYRSLDE